MPRPRLISAAELAGRLGEPGLAVVEVAHLDDDGPFREAHVPGARWTWWKDLCWHDTERRFPDGETLARRLGALGVATGDTLVLVGDPVQFGCYAVWVLHMLGRRHGVLLLDGGRAAWLAAGLPVESGRPEPEPVEHAPVGPPDFSSCVGRDGVLAALDRGDRAIVDLRSPEEYRGERVSPATAPFDHGAERKGRIPGARHLFFERLLRDDGTFRPPEELRGELASIGVDGDSDVIAYCRLGHRASLGWFALTDLVEHERVRVYDGSWTEWGSIVGVPVEL